MKNNNILYKTFLFLTVLAGLIWLGGYIARMLITFQLFEGNQFELKSVFSEDYLRAAFYTINSAITYNLITYPVFLISFFTFFIISKLSLKNNGWLFISLILILITAPFEIYLLTIDYSIATKVFYHPGFDVTNILGLTIERFRVLSSFPIIEVFIYFAIIYLFIFQPLKKKSV
jgi:hypothetical protein